MLPFNSTTGVATQPGWVCAFTTSGAVISGSEFSSRMLTTPALLASLMVLRRPAALLPLDTMNTMCSMPAVRPATARSPSPPWALAFSSTCGRLPWPTLLLLLTVLKFSPKSMPLTLLLPTFTGLKAWAVPLRPAVNTPVLSVNTVPALPWPGSPRRGSVPPTKLVTATALPVLPLARKVSTPGRLVLPPVRALGRVAVGTRTA